MTKGFYIAGCRTYVITVPYPSLCLHAAPALKTINLFQNQIGDEGARRLADALAAASAAPALKKLELSSNPASDDAKQAVKDAVNQRKPTE